MAKLYRINNWNALYENNRSRAIDDLKWVPIPNRHDGETFTLIMTHPDGAVIFAAWVLLIQIASKCKPRGTLIRGNGCAHNVTSMSAKCRAPDVWFKTALDYLENNTDWIVAEEVADERHPTDVQVAPERHPPDEERRKGIEGIEGKERKMAPSQNGFAETPSWEEFWTYCQSQTLVSEFYAKDKFLAAEADNWAKKSNWRAYVSRCRTWWESEGRPMEPDVRRKDNSKPSEPSKPKPAPDPNYFCFGGGKWHKDGPGPVLDNFKHCYPEEAQSAVESFQKEFQEWRAKQHPTAVK